MLNLDAQVRSHGVTLFRDYHDEARWWYVRDSPRLAREGGEPLFQLLLYRRDITDNPDFDPEGDRDGGGFLIMTVDLDVDQGTLEAIADDLARTAGGQVRLTPVPFVSGTVSVKALGVGPGAASTDGVEPAAGFVERVLAETRPSLLGANRAVFTVELQHEGAQLLRASLEEDGASAISVQYDLEMIGLRPARECSIHIDNRRSYQHYRSRAQASSLWFKADIDNETERLITQQVIQIEDVSYLELDATALAARELELRQLAKDLALSTYFTPTLRPGDVLAKERGTLSVYDPTADASQHTAGFTTPLSTVEGGRAADDDGPVVNPATTTRSGGVRAAGGSAEDDGGAGSGTDGEGSGTPTEEGTGDGGDDAGGTGQDRELTAVERWNKAGRPQAAYTLRSLSQVEQQTVDYDLRQVSAHRQAFAPQGSIRLLAGDADLAGRVRMVDLDDPFWDRITGQVTTTADLAAAGVSSLVVEIRYGTDEQGNAPKDTAEFRLTQAGQTGDYSFFVDHALTQHIDYRVTVHHVDDHAIGADGSSTTTEWMTTTTRSLDLAPRDVGAAQPVQVVPGQVDWTVVRQVQATVAYRDEAAGIDDQRVVVLGPESASPVTVPIRPAPGGEVVPFSVTATYFYESTHESTEQVVTRGQEAVLNQPPTRAVPVEVTVQDPLQRLAKVAVELSYQPDEGLEQTRMLTLTGGQSASWSFMRPDPAAVPGYRYRATTFATSGTTQQSDWVETTSRQLVLGDVFPALLEVSVEVVGDLAASGVQLARLVLEYADAPPGVDRRLEQALRPGQPPTPIRWVVASAVAPPTPYRWQVMWVRGPSDIVTEEGTSEQELLLLFVPPPGAVP